MARIKLSAIILLAALLSSCALMPNFGGNKDRQNRVFVIDVQSTANKLSEQNCGDLLVSDVAAAPGYRGTRMAYSIDPVEIEYYAHSRWAANAGKLLSLPIRESLEASGAFENVIASPSIAPTDLRLEVTDFQLVQRFEHRDAEQSVVDMGFSARLVTTTPTRFLRSRSFSGQQAAAPSPDSGVEATNALAAQLIGELTQFVVSGCVP